MQDTSILNLFNQLTNFQKERLNREIRGYIQFNEFVESSHYEFCPVCGIQEPKSLNVDFIMGNNGFNV